MSYVETVPTQVIFVLFVLTLSNQLYRWRTLYVNIRSFYLIFRYQGHIGAALVLGGVDVNGPCLYTIAPHGSTDKLPFVTMGESSV